MKANLEFFTELFILRLTNGDLNLSEELKYITSEWLFVLDHAKAIDLVLQKGKEGETYLVQGEEKTNLEVTRKILEVLGLDDSLIEYVEHRLGHDFRYANDGTALRELGWKPDHSFDESLEETVRWFKENEWWWKPLKGGRPVVDRVAQKSYGSKIY